MIRPGRGDGISRLLAIRPYIATATRAGARTGASPPATPPALLAEAMARAQKCARAIERAGGAARIVIDASAQPLRIDVLRIA